MSRATSNPSLHIACGVFAFLFAAYLLTYSGRIHAVDEAYMLAVTESLSKGRLDTNQVASLQWGFDRIGQVGTFAPSGDVFCKKGIAVSLFGLPLFWLSSTLLGKGAVHAALLTNAILTALTGSVLSCFLTALGFSRRTSIICSLIFGLGTLAWPYARLFFAEPSAALGLCLALYGCSLFHRAQSFRAASLCGLGLGIAIAAFSAGIIACPILGGGLVGSAIFSGPGQSRWERLWKATVGGLVGLAGPLIIVGVYNYLRFQSPWNTGWTLFIEQDFRPSLHIGLIGLLTSPARGLFVYSPVLALTLPGFPLGLRRHKFESVLTALVVTVYIGFYATWKNWHAGWSWGPRYLIPLLPLMVIQMAAPWEKLQNRHFTACSVLATLLTAVSILVQVVGVSGNYVETEFALSERFGTQGDTWFYRGREALFSLTQSPIVVQAQRTIQGHLDWSWIAHEQVDGLALGLCILALVASTTVLWTAYVSAPRFRLIAALAGLTLLVSTSGVVIRAAIRPLYDIEPDGRLEVLSYIVRQTEPGDALVSTVPYLYELMMDRYPRLPPVYGFPRQAEYPETQRLIEQAAQRHPRLWFLSVWTSPADPENRLEFWLAQHTFPLRTWEFGGHRLTLFTTPTQPATGLPARVTFADSLRLERFTTMSRNTKHGTLLQLALEWRCLQAVERDYQVFVHVYDREGNIIRQADHAPVSGFRTTSAWLPGELVTDRIALELPLDTGHGQYRLAIGLYDPLTGERLAAFSESDGLALPDGRVWLSAQEEP